MLSIEIVAFWEPFRLLLIDNYGTDLWRTLGFAIKFWLSSKILFAFLFLVLSRIRNYSNVNIYYSLQLYFVINQCY